MNGGKKPVQASTPTSKRIWLAKANLRLNHREHIKQLSGLTGCAKRQGQSDQNTTVWSAPLVTPVNSRNLNSQSMTIRNEVTT